jgi:hypothetical protein
LDPLAKEKFVNLQKYISDSENKLTATNDPEEKLEISQDVISSIDDLIDEINDERVIASAKKIRSSWFGKVFENFQESDYKNKIITTYSYKEKVILFVKVASLVKYLIGESNDEKIISSLEKMPSTLENIIEELSENIEKLIDDLEDEMQDRAVEFVLARYSNVKLKTVELLDSFSVGSNDESIFLFFYVTVDITSIYEVRTIGTILGILGNVNKVVVNGRIDMLSNTTKVLNASIQR